MLSHVDDEGRPSMVDVSPKAVTARRATARALVDFPQGILASLTDGRGDLTGPKGPVFATAIVAGVQAAKRTWELIPLCHPLPLEGIQVECSVVGPDRVEVLCTVNTTAKTGVEMEALTGASVAALTIYDMTKALSHDIVLSQVGLVHKSGGKSGAGGL